MEMTEKELAIVSMSGVSVDSAETGVRCRDGQEKRRSEAESEREKGKLGVCCFTHRRRTHRLQLMFQPDDRHDHHRSHLPSIPCRRSQAWNIVSAILLFSGQ